MRVNTNLEQHNTVGEVFLNSLERGEIRTIRQELERIKDRAKVSGEGQLNVQTYEINPLLDAQKRGYVYILRLPRANEATCAKKYGFFYDKTNEYDSFVRALAKRIMIYSIDLLHDSYWVFVNREDAERLKSALVEKQEKAELEFEIIDV